MKREERNFNDVQKAINFLRFGLVDFVEDALLKGYNVWKEECEKKRFCKRRCSNLRDELCIRCQIWKTAIEKNTNEHFVNKISWSNISPQILKKSHTEFAKCFTAERVDEFCDFSTLSLLAIIINCSFFSHFDSIIKDAQNVETVISQFTNDNLKVVTDEQRKHVIETCISLLDKFPIIKHKNAKQAVQDLKKLDENLVVAIFSDLIYIILSLFSIVKVLQTKYVLYLFITLTLILRAPIEEKKKMPGA